ncbi:RHS repeat-associated core domain-containing protein [Lacinutrix undariae]
MKQTGNYYYGARYYNPKWSTWLSVDPLREETLDSYGYCYQNPINLVDPTGMSAVDVDDIIIKGKNDTSLTIKAPGPPIEIKTDIDFGGNVKKDIGLENLEDFAIGVQKTGSVSVGVGAGGTGSIVESNVMFFDEEYGGYWNKFIGGEGSVDLGLNSTVSFSSEVSLLVGVRNEGGAFGPEGFQGLYGFGSGTVGGDLFFGGDAFIQYSKGDSWSVFEIGVAGSLDMVPGLSAFGSGGFGTSRVMNAVMPTSDRSWPDIINNQIFKNPFNPFVNGN